MSAPDSPQLVAIRSFAVWTAHAARCLNCSYDEAAVFVTKLGQFVTLMHDAVFQEQFVCYTKKAATDPYPGTIPNVPDGKGVH